MTDKPTTIVSSTFTPGDGMPTAWEAHAHVLFEQLAGFGVRLGAPALVANGSLIGLFWTLETVTEGRTDLVRLRVSEVQIEMEVYAVGHALADDGKTLDQAEAEALESEAYLDAVTLLGRVVKEVRRFLEARGLVQRVTAYVERLRLDRFFGPADAEGRREALLETVNVDGEAHELLVFDARLADLLEELGQAGWAAKVRSTPAEERGRRWIDLEKHKPLAAMAVCKAVWRRIQAERERARASRPAVVRATVTDVLLPVMGGQHTLPTLDDGRVLDSKRRELGRIALVSARMTHEGVRRGLELFGSVTGNRLLKSLVLRSHEQQERGDPFALRVRYAGGWAGMAETLGVTDKNTSSLVHLAEAGAAVVWSTPYAKGMALWALAVTRGNHLRPGEVAFTLNTPLAPGYAAELAHAKNNSLVARTARRLVPELRYEPPTGAVRPNEAGAVWTLHRRFLLELVDRTPELVAHGGIALSLDDWRRFAVEVGLPPATLPKVLDAWRAGESEAAPALLKELEPGRFTLADVHDLERRFLHEAGARRVKGREQGRKGKRAKRSEEP